MRVTVPVTNGGTPNASYLISEGLAGLYLRSARFQVATGASVTEAPNLTVINKSGQVVAQSVMPTFPAGVTVNATFFQGADSFLNTAANQAISAIPELIVEEGDRINLSANDPGVVTVSALVLTFE